MIKINLLPYREKKKKENVKRQLFVISGAMVLFFLVVVAVHLYFVSSLHRLDDKVKEREARLLVLDKKVGDVEKFKKDKKELEQKLAVINKLELDRYFPVRLLDRLNLLVPSKDAWLEKIAQKGQEIRIEGMARDNGVVAVFMKTLEKADFVRSVDLVVTREKDIVGVKLQQFVLKCMVDSKGE
jgi:type IV pilus assembly protein PilN